MMVKSWDCCIDMLYNKDKKRAAEVYEFKMVQWYTRNTDNIIYNLFTSAVTLLHYNP